MRERSASFPEAPPSALWIEPWKLFGRAVFGAVFGLRVEGLEHVPARGGVIIAANHPSYLDPVFLCAWLPRRVRVMTWDVVFGLPIIGRWARASGAFPVRIGDGRIARGSLDVARAVLDRGDALVVFPEGGRSEEGGEMLPARPGIGRLAAQTGCPIVCAAILGSWYVWPRSRRLWRPGQVRILIRPPLRPDEDERRERVDDRTYHRELAARVDNELRTIVDEARLDVGNRRGRMRHPLLTGKASCYR